LGREREWKETDQRVNAKHINGTRMGVEEDSRFGSASFAIRAGSKIKGQMNDH
jgi:hypothetical protein